MDDVCFYGSELEQLRSEIWSAHQSGDIPDRRKAQLMIEGLWLIEQGLQTVIPPGTRLLAELDECLICAGRPEQRQHAAGVVDVLRSMGVEYTDVGNLSGVLADHTGPQPRYIPLEVIKPEPKRQLIT